MRIALLFVCTGVLMVSACRNKNPNLSKEELVTELDTEIEIQKDITEIPEGYIPPPGIKYTKGYYYAEPLIRLDILPAFSNERAVKLSDFGSEVIYHRVGEFEYRLSDNIQPAGKNGYLAKTTGGLWLLDENFRKERELIKEDVEVFKSPNGIGYKPYKMINSYYYDPGTKAVRCTFMTEKADENFGFDYFSGTILLDELLDSPSPLDINNIKNRVQIGQAADLVSIGDSYGLYGIFIPGLYTFSPAGDTLCHLTPGNNTYAHEEFKGMGTIRGAESTNAYSYKGQSTIRLAFTDTVFRIIDDHTFYPVYKIGLGNYQVNRNEGMDTKTSLSDKYLVHGLIETDNYLFIRITRDYDCPNTRKSGSLKFYQLIYDKKAQQLYSFQDKRNLSEPGMIPNDIDGGPGFWPSLLIGDSPYMKINGQDLKKELSAEKLAAIPALQDLTDDDYVLITIK